MKTSHSVVLSAFVFTLMLVGCDVANTLLAGSTDLEKARSSLVITYSGSDSADSVTGDLGLVTSTGNSVAVSWASSNASVVSSSGKVTRPAVGLPAAKVTLTATLRAGGDTATKDFAVTVKALVGSDSQTVASAKAALALAYPEGIPDVYFTSDLSLPTSLGGAAISWSSDKPQIISPTGVVTRPAGTANYFTMVTLTATITAGTASDTKAFPCRVLELGLKPMPAATVLRGSMNQWGSPSWPLVSTGGTTVHQLFLAESTSIQFKVATPATAVGAFDYWYDATQLTYDTTRGGLPRTAVSKVWDSFWGYNISLETVAGKVYDLVVEPSSLQYWVSDVTADSNIVYLRGDFTPSGWSSSPPMVLEASGILRQRFVAAGTLTQFKFANSDWSLNWGPLELNYDSTRATVPVSEVSDITDYTLNPPPHNIGLATEVGKTYDVWFDQAALKYWVTTP